MLTETFAGFIADTTFAKIPPETAAIAKERILDTVGAALAGAAGWDYRERFLSACRRFGAGDNHVIAGGGGGFPLERAAMINATFAHAVELDDGHRNAGVHAGAAVVMAALTLGAKLGSSGKDIITATVIGYDIVYRLASSMAPHQIQKGFHPSGNDDAVGAMAVAGKLLGLNRDQLANGLGLAALYAAGLMEATVSGQQSKCILIGNAVYNGIAAAYYAQEDMEGTRSAFEGKAGFFQAKSENVDLDKVCEGLGVKFLIGETYSKLYPTCRHAQPAIETALDLAEENGFTCGDIKHVDVGTFQVAFDLTGKITRPTNPGEAKFSIPYGIAVAVRERSFGTAHLTEAYYTDEELLAAAAKVTVTVAPDVQTLYPKKRGARVCIELNDGRTFVRECYDLKGSPDKPIGREEIEKKFRANAAGVFSPEKIERALELIFSLDENAGVKELMDILR